MFNKLRNRFLIMNLVIISLIMLGAFVIIYTITYENVCRDIDKELYSVSKFYSKPERDQANQQPQQLMSTTNLQPGLAVTFEIQTDRKWNITAKDSIFKIDSELYELAKNKVASKPSDSGRFNLNGYKWEYTVQPTETGFTIIYLDVTSQLRIVTYLVYTFIAVGLVMFIIIFFVSRFFANRYIAPVKEAFNKQKQFIADASHELKTPLTVISTNTDVLISNSEDTIQNQSKWLYRIKSETERMKTLTGDLLYLTEMDDARASMIFAPFNISEAVESVILTMEAVIFEKNIMLCYEIEPNLTVRGNMEQIKQVVMILLDNAINYTNAKGSITLKLKKRHHDIMLTVTNTGDGIASEHLDKIFDRFYRTDPSRSRQHGGYGLGLAIAKSIVEQHKGKIYAKSTVNESTTFYVHFH
jgi:two-component system, OmpR family, sensor histidine kinase CiaH